MEQNRTFLENFKYDYWILHKKIVWDEIFTIFDKIIHISFNIGLRILNLHTLGHRFPSAGHKYLLLLAYLIVAFELRARVGSTNEEGREQHHT